VPILVLVPLFVIDVVWFIYYYNRIIFKVFYKYLNTLVIYKVYIKC
jgi:hypothetical protein